VLVKGYGGARGEQRVLIASLSKAITATCTAALIQSGKLRFETTLEEVLPARYGKPADPRLRTVTIAQLLTHRAGFSRAAGGDPATGATLAEVLARRAVSQATMHDLVPGVLRARLEHEPGTTYAYTNATYLLLGIAIEQITGKRYADHCGASVLEPHGVKDPQLHPTWHMLGSFGGWNLSGPEYLAFLRDFAPGSAFFGTEARQFLVGGAGKEISSTGPVFYSFILVRPLSSGGHNFFHAGSWGYRSPASSPSGWMEDSIGALAVSAAFGASWFAWFEPRPSDTARAALDRELYRAAESVRRWSGDNRFAPLGLR
jgi:CubicO group peptidase (beta-lactamase class C family)